jgi:hypothetical protein
VNNPRLGTFFPTVCTAGRKQAVESARPQVQSVVKSRLDAHVREPRFAHSSRHGAKGTMHPAVPGSQRKAAHGKFSGGLFPQFLMAVVGVKQPGHASVGTFLESETGAAAAGIEKSVGEFGQQLGLVAGAIP